jgi:hypothetical protein
MGDASKHANVDVDFVAAQFDLLDKGTHREALLDAIRTREVCTTHRAPPLTQPGRCFGVAFRFGAGGLRMSEPRDT